MTVKILETCSVATVSEFIKYNHPQVIAAILAQLDDHFAAKVLETFATRLRNDVMLRISSMSTLSHDAVSRLDECCQQILQYQEPIRAGGIFKARDILRFVDGQTGEDVIDSMRDYDPNLAHKILSISVFDGCDERFEKLHHPMVGGQECPCCDSGALYKTHGEMGVSSLERKNFKIDYEYALCNNCGKMFVDREMDASNIETYLGKLVDFENQKLAKKYNF